MTLGEFCTRYNGKKVDFDGYGGAQCVDLARQYMQDVYEIPRTESLGEDGGAKDLFLKYEQMPLEKKYLKKVKSVTVGDLVVFNGTVGNKYGHVAILILKMGKDLLVFEQNGFTQDGAKYNWRSIDNLLGGLRKK